MADNKNIVYKIHVDESGSIATVRKLDGTIVATKLDVKELRKEFGNFSVSAKNATTIAAKEFDRFGKSAKAAKVDMHGVSNATGSASASVLEMGRTISDSNYGLRGMANNLSQLASNMVYTAKSAGGFVAGLKEIGKAMLGPLGIILLIQAAIAYFEKLSMRTEEAGDSLDSFASKSVTNTSAKLMLLRDALNDTNMSLDAKNKLIKKASEEFPELNIAIDENNRLNADSITILDNQIDALMRNAKAKAISEAATDAYKKVISEEVKTAGEALSWYNKMYQAVRVNLLGGSALEGALNQGLKDRKKNIDEANESLQKYIDLLKKEDEDGSTLLELLFGKDAGKKKGSGSERIRIFKSKILNLYNEFNSYVAEQRKLREREALDLLKIEQEYEITSLEQKLINFKQKRKIDLENYLRRIKDLDNFKELEKEAIKVHDQDIENAEEHHRDVEHELRGRHDLETIRLKEEQADKLAEIEFNTRAKSIKNMISLYDEQRIIQNEYETQLQQNRIAQAELEASRFDEGSNERLIAEQQISQMRMDLQTRELEHELMIIEAKKNANMEYANYMAEIGGIMTTIAGNNKELAIAALLVTKGAAIAQIVIAANTSIAQATASTIAANQGYLASTAPLGPAGWSLAGGMIAANNLSLAQGIGRTKVRAGLSIASILAQTITSLTGGGGINAPSTGGGSGGNQGREFDFNLVGSTGQNQLASIVGGQIQNPIRAYVVSSEITNQQALDNQIQGSATIGD